jgi:aminomethyltransferase
MTAALAAELSAARSGAALFRLAGRGVLAVSGADRVRWLDGMISADVKALAPGGGAPALLLTRQGRIVADLHVLAREGALWLELEASALAGVRERLLGYVIADDVGLEDVSPAWARLAVEGPRAAEILAAAGADPGGVAAHGWREAQLGGAGVVLAAWALAGGPGFQLFVPREAAAAAADALLAAGASAASDEAFECLRIAAGVPRLGHELDESVLPAEARLEAAVSITKGCYTGQEVVTRMRSRGRVGHLLMGLRFETEALPAPGAEIAAGSERIGQLTSRVLSPADGAIGLGFVRAEDAQPGAEVVVGGAPAKLVEPGAAGTGSPAATGGG